MTIHLRHETPDDVAAIEAVTIAAFADAPHTSHTEQFILRALRAAGELTLSIAAEEHGQVVGHVALSPVTITDGHGHQAAGWYGLGPISVLPQRQGHGIGSRLMEQALSELRAMQAAGCVLLGDPAYYGRFGFQAHAGLQLPGVPPGYFVALALHGSVLVRLLALNTGRGHGRAGLCVSPRPGRNGLGAVLTMIIPSFR